MKRWITALAACVLVLSVGAPTLAQNTTAAPKAAKGQRAGGANKRLQAALAKLNLTAEQKPKVDAALKASAEESKKIRESAETPQERRPKLRAAQKELMTRLNSILTPEQQKQLKEELASGKKGARGGKRAKTGK